MKGQHSDQSEHWTVFCSLHRVILLSLKEEEKKEANNYTEHCDWTGSWPSSEHLIRCNTKPTLQAKTFWPLGFI